jgi:EmrB/QacA subfamily drug resistance transporter
MRTPIDPRQRRVALLVAACMFMELLDATIVTTSAPSIARSLGVSAGGISLIITAYMVTLATLIPASGWLSARFGTRRVVLAAIAIFTLASLGCGLSQNLPELVVMRVLQGVGGAMMVPVGRALVLSGSAKENIMRLTAYLVWPALVAPVLAPLAGGLITTYASWHWLFLINLPLGAVALVVAARIVRPLPQGPPGRLDLVGGVLTCLGLAGLTVTLALLADASSKWSIVVGGGVASLLFMALAARHLLRTPAPLVDLRTLQIPTLRAAISGTALYFPVMAAGPFLVPLMLEEAFGWSAVKAGSIVLLIFVGNIGVKPATTYLYGRFGFRAVLVASTGLMAATMVAIAFTAVSTPVAVIGTILLLSGVARSVGATGYTTMAFGDVPKGRMRDASTLQATVQQLGAGLGVAGAAIALRIGHSVGGLLSSNQGPATEYRVAFILVALVALVATAEAGRLHPGAGDVLRGSRARQPAPADANA